MDEIYKIFDNKNKTIDRYTVLTEPWYNGKSCDSLSMSDNPDSPLGFNQYTGDVYEGSELGKEISYNQLPESIQRAIMEGLESRN